MTTTAVTSRRNNSRRGTKIKKSMACGVCDDGVAKYKCPKCRFPYCSVKCCKEHKESCPALKSTDGSSYDKMNARKCAAKLSSIDGTPSQSEEISKYLSAEQLTRDPLENSVRRRRMLDESDEEDDLDDSWRITRDMMDRIDNSEWLRKELSDGGLRQIIAQIDMANDNMDNYERGRRKRPKLGTEPDPSPREIALMKAKHTNPKFSNFVDRLLLTSEVLVEGEKTKEQEIASLLLGKNEFVGPVSLAPLQKRTLKKFDNEEPNIAGSDDNDDSSSDDGDTSSSSS